MLLALAGCVETGSVSGKPPERVTRELPNEGPVVKPPLSELYKQHANKSEKGDSKIEKTDPADMRVGVASTHFFHRTSCLQLKEVPVAEQVRFTSRWDALDGGFRPCEECKSDR